MHPDDASWAFTAPNQLPPFYSAPRTPSCEILPLADHQLRHTDVADFRIIHTPGHSPGGVCCLLEKEKMLLTGDTLFKGSVGRTDLPGGNASELTRSINRLKQLPDALRIIPGHGPESTMSSEKSSNYFMRGEPI